MRLSYLVRSLALGTALILPEMGAAVGSDPLAAFLPDEGSARALQPVIDRLESESFADREAASKELRALPALPASLRELAARETRAESGFRLRALAAGFSLDLENLRLTRVLQDIADKREPGHLDTIGRVIRRNLWTPDETVLHAAARATATPADLPLLATLAQDPCAHIRGIAAAALGALPAAESSPALFGLLDDPDAATAYLAAAELAARRDPRALATFARLLEAPDFLLRHRCHSALLGLTGQNFGYDPSAADVERREPAAKWRHYAAAGDAAITGTIPKDSTIALFNGRDFQGWEVRAGIQPVEPQAAWEIKGDEIHCVGEFGRKPGDLWTARSYENYVLTLEYRAKLQSSDSGVGLLLTREGERGAQGPAYLEVQLLPGSGGDLYQIGGIAAEAGGHPISFVAQRTAAVDDQAAKWHLLKLTVRDGSIEVCLDGTVVNRSTKGPRGPGRIVLRNEGTPMAFRHLLLSPLPTGKAADP